MTINVITKTESDTNVVTFRNVFTVLTVNQKAVNNGLWLKVIYEDPTKEDDWIEYDPDYDIVNIINI